MTKGVLGSSRLAGSSWSVVTWAAAGSAGRSAASTSVVYRGRLEPGETIQIGHQAETYDGQAGPRRRRKIRAA